MKRFAFFKKIFCTLALSAAVAVSPLGVFAADTDDDGNGAYTATLYNAVLEFVEDNYKFGVSREELLSAAVTEFLKAHPEYYDEFGKAAFTALDPNSRFYTAEEYKSASTDVSGVYVGIGINVHQDKDSIILGEAFEGSPAQKSGLRVGDVLTAVNGEDVTSYALDKVTSLIKGEAGTAVEITVSRSGTLYTYTLTRAQIKINPVTYKMVDGSDDIGYIKISSFNANTVDAFEEAAEYFGEKGVQKIILDLRNNLGGYLTAAVGVASYFVPDGSLLVTAEYKEDKAEYYSEETDFKFKAVVLVNGYSASASELVASAIRDYKAGFLVGRRTYGKGTVQNTFKIVGGHCLWLTVAEYYTPSHTEIHEVGLLPDYNVSNSEDYFNMKNVTSYEIKRVLKEGDVGSDVYAVKERLIELGYQLELNETFDSAATTAVKSFQKQTGLYVYGVADFTTQHKINEVLANTLVEVDNQLEKAIEVAHKK